MIEKILKRLSEERIKEQEFRSKRLKENALRDANDAHERILTLNKIEAIVQEVAKDGGWIPCSERLPEEQDEYLVFWTAEGFKGKCLYEIIEYHLEDGWIGEIPQAPHGKYTVIAWQPLPAPYQRESSMSELKITQCKGEGQGSCKRCTDNGKWNRSWMCFLYKIEGMEGCYCSDCVKEIKQIEQKGE